MKAVILAGGGGTRLWPLSVPERPKQFQKIISDKTMIEETIARLDFLEEEDIFIAITKDQESLLKNILPKFPEENIIIEPALRDTSSCIGLAAAIIEKKSPGEVMAVIYADHLVKNKEEFQEKLLLAEKIAIEEDTLNIIELTATEPNTNYGYVKVGKMVKTVGDTAIYELDSFKEKPDFETAKKFVSSGDYLWNTGIYVWKAKTLLNHYKNLQAESYKTFSEIMDSLGTENETAVIDTLYPLLEKISIDFAIMEKVDPKQIRVIKAELGWSDIGNWEAIWEESSKSKDGNISRGDTKLIDCNDCIVYSDNDKKIAAIGLDDLIIIDTKHGLLVCKKNQSKRVKEI